MANANYIYEWRSKFIKEIDYSTEPELSQSSETYCIYVPKTDLGLALLTLEREGVSCEEDSKGNLTFKDLSALIDAEFTLDNNDIEFTVDDVIEELVNEAYNNAETVI